MGEINWGKKKLERDEYGKEKGTNIAVILGVLLQLFIDELKDGGMGHLEVQKTIFFQFLGKILIYFLGCFASSQK